MIVAGTLMMGKAVVRFNVLMSVHAVPTTTANRWPWSTERLALSGGKTLAMAIIAYLMMMMGPTKVSGATGTITKAAIDMAMAMGDGDGHGHGL